MTTAISTNKILVFLILCVFCSCSLANKGESSVYAKGSGYEVETIPQQLTQELEAYPTRFTVPVGEGKPSLERAFFFFRTYTSSYEPKDISATDRNINLTSEKSKDLARYRVARVLVKDGFRYSISASVRNDPQRSKILAANLARFIKDSNLEVSLLSVR